MKTQKTQFKVLPVKLWFVQCVAEAENSLPDLGFDLQQATVDKLCQKLNCLPNSMSRLGWRIGFGEFIEGFAGKNAGSFMLINSIGNHVGGKFAHLSEAPVSSGHTICFLCKIGPYNCCPICCQELGNIRCVSLENVANLVELPCRYQLLGCPCIFTHHSRLSHEQNCRFRPYGCPYDGAACLANGDIQFLLGHLKDDQNVEMHDGCTFNPRYINSNPQEFANATWMLTVMKCFGHHFCLDFQSFYIKGAPVYMAILRFMGDDDEAKKFRYSLEFGDDTRKLTWVGVPRSIRDSTKTVRESSDGLIIHRNIAHSLSGDDGQEVKIKVVGRIWKEE